MVTNTNSVSFWGAIVLERKGGTEGWAIFFIVGSALCPAGEIFNQNSAESQN